MKSIYRHKEKATVCSGKICVTVYDEAAEVVNTLAIIAVAIVAISLIVKVLR